MTQDERWFLRYNEVKTFIETNHRSIEVLCRREIDGSFPEEREKVDECGGVARAEVGDV